jgi:hypothetical protein
MSNQETSLDKDLLIKFMEEVRNDVNYIKEVVAQNATSQAILTTKLDNHIKQEETIEHVKKEHKEEIEKVKEDAYKKVGISYLIVGILVTLIIFIAGYKIAENNNKYFQRNEKNQTEQPVKR